MTSEQPQKVAVLGGGVASLVTALELTNQPGWRERYDITVYQLGWRLGGKCASGRNRHEHERIEEHGLHMFFGFYENAFRVMRQVYAELGRHPDAPLATWEQAFKKQSVIASRQMFRGRWHDWVLPAPLNSGVPGDGDAHIDPWHLFEELLQLITDVFDRWWLTSRKQSVSASVDALDDLAEHIENIVSGDLSFAAHSALFDKLAAAALSQLKLVSKVTEPVASPEMGFLHLALKVVQRMPRDPHRHLPQHHDALHRILKRFRTWFHDALGPHDQLDWEAFQVLTLVDLGLAGLTGMLDDDLIRPPVNWQKLDDEDFQAWLMRHGALESSVQSAPLRGLRSAAFATNVTGAAGTSMYLALRLLFTYQGAIVWELQAGMGDTIFAPMYTVLRRRGVRFRFFQRVDQLELSEPDAQGKRRIARVIIGQQATLKAAQYEPLRDVKGLPCWPSEPDYDQLHEGDALRASGENLEDWWTRWKDPVAPVVLEADRDFDHLVFGLGLGVVPYVARALIDDAREPRWKQMVDNVQTTLTQAAQLWLTPDLAALGWPTQKPVVVGYTEPFDTWSDMSHLLVREQWPERTVGNLAYLCCALEDEPGTRWPPRSDHHYPHRLRDRVFTNLQRFLDQDVGSLWPRATITDQPTRLNYDWLVDTKQRSGADRLRAQYWIADWNPSDRYVLSVAGSTRHRLPPGDSGYSNLTVTGDWTLNGFSSGCVESAVAAGMHASRALSGHPRTIIGEWMDALPKRQRYAFDPDAPDPQRRAAAAGHGVQATRPEPGFYVRRDGDLLPLQPFRAEGAELNWFVLEADSKALQAMCDAHLNFRGSPWEYRPLLPLVCFIATSIDKMYPLDPAYDQGFMPERDFAYWVPVVAGRSGGGSYQPERFAFYNPYMFVDSALAMQGGRDIYGMLKAHATLTSPQAATDAARFDVVAEMIASYPPSCHVAPTSLLRVHNPQYARWGDHAQGFRALDEALPQVEAMLRDLATRSSSAPIDWALGLDLLTLALKSETRIVSMRQYPDVHDASRACYQAIVETISKPITPVGFRFLEPGWELNTSCFYNPNIAQALGLVGEREGNVVRALSVMSFQLKFDFDLDNGTVVYRAA